MMLFAIVFLRYLPSDYTSTVILEIESLFIPAELAESSFRGCGNCGNRNKGFLPKFVPTVTCLRLLQLDVGKILIAPGVREYTGKFNVLT